MAVDQPHREMAVAVMAAADVILIPANIGKVQLYMYLELVEQIPEINAFVMPFHQVYRIHGAQPLIMVNIKQVPAFLPALLT